MVNEDAAGREDLKGDVIVALEELPT